MGSLINVPNEDCDPRATAIKKNHPIKTRTVLQAGDSARLTSHAAERLVKHKNHTIHKVKEIVCILKRGYITQSLTDNSSCVSLFKQRLNAAPA